LSDRRTERGGRKGGPLALAGVWATLLTLVYITVLVVRPAEAWFGVPGQWTWSGRPPSPATVPRWMPAIVVLLILVCGGLLLDRRWDVLERWQRVAAIAGLVVAIPVCQVALKYIHYRYPVEYYLYRTIGPHNGFWQASVAIESIGDYLRTYPEQMRAMRGVYVHLPVHPPGNVLYIWGWRQMLERLPGVSRAVAHWLRGYNCADLAFVTLEDAQIASALGQMAITALSGVTVAPLYCWVKGIADRRSAWRASLLFSLTPALSLFTMRWDAGYPVFTALAFCFLHRGLVTRRAGYWFASGFVVSAASFCSFGNATLAPAVALYGAFRIITDGRVQILAMWRQWLALIVGGYSVWSVYQVATGATVWAIFATTLETHLNLGRTYWPWVIYNLYDLLVFLGIGTVVLAAWAWKGTREGGLSEHTALVATVVVTAALSLTGVVRGEVGRMWLPWAPVFCLSAAVVACKTPGRWMAPTVVSLVALQTLLMTLYLRVSPTGMPSYSPRQVSAEQQRALYASAAVELVPDVAFEQDIALVGHDLRAGDPAAQTLDVRLFWSASRRPDLPYTVFVHVLDGSGEIIAQHDGMPVENRLPTSCWLAGEVVEDVHVIELPADLEPRDLVVDVGLYYLPTLDRLRLADDAGSTSVRLSPSLTQH